jgi:hypothetical protein
MSQSLRYTEGFWSGIMETFWPTVGMVEPLLGGGGAFGRYSDFIFSRSVWVRQFSFGPSGWRDGSRTVLPALSRPRSLREH